LLAFFKNDFARFFKSDFLKLEVVVAVGLVVGPPHRGRPDQFRDLNSDCCCRRLIEGRGVTNNVAVNHLRDGLDLVVVIVKLERGKLVRCRLGDDDDFRLFFNWFNVTIFVVFFLFEHIAVFYSVSSPLAIAALEGQQGRADDPLPVGAFYEVTIVYAVGLTGIEANLAFRHFVNFELFKIDQCKEKAFNFFEFCA